MDQELATRLDAQDQKLNAIYSSVEKTRKYFLWTMIGSIVVFVVPLLGILIAIPWLLSTLSSTYSGLL